MLNGSYVAGKGQLTDVAAVLLCTGAGFGVIHQAVPVPNRS